MKEQFLKNRMLILHYYIAAALAALSTAWWVSRKETIDQPIWIVLALYLAIFPVIILYTRKYAVHIFLFALAFITGFYSFYYYSVEPHSLLNALYFTFQLYLLNMTEVFTADGSALLEYPFVVEIARWSAALYTISTLFIAMYRTLEMSILLSFYQIAGNHTIVFGYNDSSLTFIENLHKKKQRVILVANDVPKEITDYLEGMKVVVLHNREQDELVYTRCGITRASRVFLMHEQDADNLDELMDVQYSIRKHAGNKEKLPVYIHLHENASKKLFLDLIQTTNEIGQDLDLRLVNSYELFVDDLLAKHPIYSTQKDNVHLLIIGFGTLGQWIAKKAIEQSEETGTSQLSITALDKMMPQAEKQWLRNFPELKGKHSVTLHSFDVSSDSIEHAIEKQQQPITHIYVCIFEEHLDLWAAVELSKQFPDIPVYLEFSKGSIVEKWVESRPEGNRRIYSMGTFKDILTEEEMT